MSIGLHPARSLAWKIARLYPPSGGVKRTVSGQPVACVRCAWVGDANCPGRGRTLDHRFAADGGEGARARQRDAGAGGREGCQDATRGDPAAGAG
jgi:hypothetical protein